MIPSFNGRMYHFDGETGDTVFRVNLSPAAQHVFLIGHCDQATCRVEMRAEGAVWTARLRLRPGWFFYRFEVDGRPFWDRDFAKLKTDDGHACSLAVISAKAARNSLRVPRRNSRPSEAALA